MIGLVRLDLRLTTAVELADLVADLDAAVRHRRHDFRELSPAQGRDFRPWASADAEPAGLNPPFQKMQQPVASAGREQVAPIVADSKVEDHSAKVVDCSAQHSAPLGVVHPATVRLAVAKVRPAVARVAEPLVVQSRSVRPAQRVLQREPPDAAPLALVSQQKVEPRESKSQRVQPEQLVLAQSPQPEGRRQEQPRPEKLERPAP